MEIKNPDDLESWLRGRPPADARVIACRTALRVLPLLAGVSSTDSGRALTFTELTSVNFRGTSLAWSAAKYPARANELSPADAARDTNAAARDVNSANNATGAGHDATAAVAAAVTAAAAATTAYAAYASAASADASTDAYAASAAANTAAAAENAFAANGIGDNPDTPQEQIWRSISSDVLALAEGLAPDLLANRALWPGGIPHSISFNWRTLVQFLPPNGDWDVWTQWYERRLIGRAYPESYEIVFARVPDEEWKKGPVSANAWIKTELAKLERKPIQNVTSVFTFQWNEANRIALSSGPQNLPVFPFPGNEADHRSRLDAERALAERLISDIAQKQYNIRSDYLDSLRRYASDLPASPVTGNFLLADAEARILRALFESEADSLPQGFAARLKIMLEQHIALRAFYPEVERFYLDVRKGRLEEPLPQDAVERATRTIVEYTPKFFEQEVTAGLREVERAPPQIFLSDEDIAAHAPGVILPPADPIGTLDLKKSRDFSTAAAFNKLMEVAEKGDKVAGSLEGWGKVFHQLSDNIGPIIDWLSRQMGN
jgi:hypothetical protein